VSGRQGGEGAKWKGARKAVGQGKRGIPANLWFFRKTISARQNISSAFWFYMFAGEN
jgi:hypothetical protein